METLKKYLPFSRQEGLQELKNIIVRFEKNIYSAATSESDYLRKISLKMLTVEARAQSPAAYFLETNAASASSTSSDTTSLDSTAESGNNTDVGDWQEETYQKIKSLKGLYLLEMNEIYLKIAPKLQQYETRPQQLRNEQFEKLKCFNLMLERLMQFMQLSKNDIQISHKDKLGSVEKLITTILHSNKPRETASLQPGQLPPLPHMSEMRKTIQASETASLQTGQLPPPPHMSEMQNTTQASETASLQPGQLPPPPHMSEMQNTTQAIDQLIEGLQNVDVNRRN